jgi:hypothetical protein
MAEQETKHDKSGIAANRIAQSMAVLRGHKVMLDGVLAELYQVEIRVLNQAVKRNLVRFPDDFMFQLTATEVESLRSQFVILENGRGKYAKYLPYAFTEQGVAMLSTVLRSQRAILVNIEIMRAFVRMRQMVGSSPDLARKLDALERKYDGQFKVVFSAIKELMVPIETKKKRQIGFGPWEEK